MFNRSVAALLFVAFLLRLGAGEYMLWRRLDRLPDSELYVNYASTIDRGAPFDVAGDRARRTPGYPLFIVIAWRLFGHADRSILLLQAIVATGTVAVAHGMSKRFESMRAEAPVAMGKSAAGAPLFALLFATFDPYAIVLSGMVLSETLAAFLLALAGMFALAASNSNNPWFCRLFGISAAAGVLVRPSSLFLALIGMGWLWRRATARGGVLRAILWFVITMSPWWARNAAVYGIFVATTLNVGESLYDGVGPQATGASEMTFTRLPRLASLTEIERDQHWMRESWKQIVSDPGRIVRLIPIKIARFLSPWPNETQFRGGWLVLLTTLGTVPIGMLAIVGAWQTRTTPSLIAFAIGPLCYFAMLHSLFVSSVRYRVPAMPFLCVLAGTGCASLAWFLRDGRGSSKTSENETGR
ncbi:MAG: hypothetical protein U1D30_22650 [Planctomycetota bacterium]